MARWNLDSIPWHQFDPQKAGTDFVILAKTASVVEFNSQDYTTYLENVFPDDPEFQKGVRIWGEEERQHGLALATWAKMADPDFDFDNAMARFRSAFRVNTEASESIRGSRSRELVARCIVECGTTSYYSSLRDACDEPVFKAICNWIAVDEIHHYNLFYRTLQRYLKSDPVSQWERAKVALERSAEVESDELLYAFAAATLDEEICPERKPYYLQEYLGRTYGLYTHRNLHKGIALACRSVGLEKQPWIAKAVSTAAYSYMWLQAKRMKPKIKASAVDQTRMPHLSPHLS